jgi:hypothetical protein
MSVKPNPQDLINLPGAGSAEKDLRKAGMWRVTITDEERIEYLAYSVVKMEIPKYESKWIFSVGDTDLEPDHLRDDIDELAMAMEANQ